MGVKWNGMVMLVQIIVTRYAPDYYFAFSFTVTITVTIENK